MKNSDVLAIIRASACILAITLLLAGRFEGKKLSQKWDYLWSNRYTRCTSESPLPLVATLPYPTNTRCVVNKNTPYDLESDGWAFVRGLLIALFLFWIGIALAGALALPSCGCGIGLALVLYYLAFFVMLGVWGYYGLMNGYYIAGGFYSLIVLLLLKQVLRR